MVSKRISLNALFSDPFQNKQLTFTLLAGFAVNCYRYTQTTYSFKDMQPLPIKHTIALTRFIQPSQFHFIGKIIQPEPILKVAHWIDSVQKIESIWNHQDHSQALKNASYIITHYHHLFGFEENSDEIFVTAIRIASIYLKILAIHQEISSFFSSNIAYSQKLIFLSKSLQKASLNPNKNLKLLQVTYLIKLKATLLFNYLTLCIHSIFMTIVSCLALCFSFSIPDNYYRYQAHLILADLQLQLNDNSPRFQSMIRKTGELFQLVTSWLVKPVDENLLEKTLLNLAPRSTKLSPIY